MTEPQHITV